MAEKKNLRNIYDLIVIGLGTAGAAALIRSADSGLSVLGIEYLSQMGGTSTAGGVSHYYYGVDGGFYKQLDLEADRLRSIIHMGRGGGGVDVAAYVLEKNAVERNADIMYECRVTEVLTDGKKICGVKCLKNGKHYEIFSKMIIDATGDAEICEMAGCRMQGGRSSDGQMQTYANVLTVMSNGDVYGINKDAGYVNQSKCRELSQAVISSSAFLYDICREYNGRMNFISSAMLIGCREGKRICGIKNITFDDGTECRQGEKTLFYTFSNIDSHSKDIAFESRNIKDWYIAAGLWGVCVSCAVDADNIIPAGPDGILAAGRCIATEHDMAGCVRMMRDMKKCGEAAAQIAYLSIREGCSPSGVNYKTLLRLLHETGCLYENQEPMLASRGETVGEYRRFKWLESKEEIIKGLATDKPGVAIWSAKRMGDEIKDRLLTALHSENKLLSVNSAFALALIGDKSAVPILRELVRERSIYIPKSSVKFTYAWGVSAEYLLGRLGDTGSAKLLLEVIETNGSFDETAFAADELHANAEDMRFMFVSNALAALLEICDCCSDDMKKSIIEGVRDKISGNIEISLKDNQIIKYNMSDIFARQLEKYLSYGGQNNEAATQ